MHGPSTLLARCFCDAPATENGRLEGSSKQAGAILRSGSSAHRFLEIRGSGDISAGTREVGIGQSVFDSWLGFG